ncbi:hypothetical protein C8R43DRAFT_885487 [Mycena crocata]|nr:hypothetical protein C8R43DRAFT_885487 [Mycena crocata]
MSTTEAILQNAAYHAQLLASIAELDYVPSALEHQTSYLANIEKNKQQTSAKIKLLEKKTNKERKEHEALRDSTARRLAAKLTGRKEKFEAKASKEEREYVEALDQEIQEKRSLETLDELLVAGKEVLADLQGKEERYKLTKQDLADLYRKIFDGPTQAYPEDDRLEQQLAQVQGRYNAIQGFLNQESQAVNLLKLANSTLIQCSSKMQEALSYSQFDMFGGGGVADMMERNALSAAEGLSNQAATLVQQAMFASPQVQPIGEVRIAHGSIISDVLFDNIFTDMAFHGSQSLPQISSTEKLIRNLTNQLAAAKARTAAIGEDLRSAADDLTRARGALDSFRRSVFDSLSGNIPPLPAYDAPAGPPPGHPGMWRSVTPPSRDLIIHLGYSSASDDARREQLRYNA